MEAAGLYENFEANLMMIQRGLKSNIPYQKTALPDALPLELSGLVEALNKGGASFRMQSNGLAMVDEFIEQYRPQHDLVNRILQQQLSDSRSTMWVEGIGTLLVKEVVIRRLEYLNEAAALLHTMMMQARMSGQRVLESYNEVAPNPNKTYRKKG